MKRWKIAIVLSTAFLLGMLAGGLLTARLYQNQIRKTILGGPVAMTDLAARRLGARLELDDEQNQRLRVIFRDAQQETRFVRRQVDSQTLEILNRTEVRVRAILKPDQVKEFNKLVAEVKARWKEVNK